MTHRFKPYHDPEMELPDRPSKTRRKQDMDRHQQLGELLLGLTVSKRQNLPINDSLRAALDEMSRIKAREAQRRHRQYIGKLMRQQDLSELLAALDEAVPRSGKHIPLDTLVQRLVQEGDKALMDTVQRYPGCDRGYVRELIEQIEFAEDNDSRSEFLEQLRLYILETDILGR